MSTGEAARRYAATVHAAAEQRSRLLATEHLSTRWDRSSPGFRFDPRRPLEPHIERIASYVRPADSVIEVGGGAGRVGLPVALRSAHLINVEPSRGMGEQFTASASDAKIANVTLVSEPWPAAATLVADIVLTEDVAYFVEDIEPFIAALAAAARRRVVMGMWSVPPPNRNAALFELVFREPKAPVPGHQQLLPVLWEMRILPDIVAVPEMFTWPETLPKTPAEAVTFALNAIEAPATTENVRRVTNALPELFTSGDAGLQPAWRTDGQALLVTWGAHRPAPDANR
jgi:hypothetical protein